MAKPLPLNDTDLSNAQRLIRAFGKKLHYCPQLGQHGSWFIWNDRRWRRDGKLRVMQLATETVKRMYAHAATLDDDRSRLALTAHARNSESASRLRAMVELAKSRPGIPITPDELDRDPALFNVLNGTLDLHTGELRTPRREDLITHLAPVTYDPSAECPRWKKFLHAIFAGNEDLIDFVHRAVGYTLSGTCRERVLIILNGAGSNGKTTFCETLAEVFGRYGTVIDMETLLIKKWDRIPNDLARLYRKRFVRAAESDETAKWKTDRIKQITGRGTITARFLYKEYFEFRPEFVIWVETNHLPIIGGTDQAIWDRIRVVPFNVRFYRRDEVDRPEEAPLVNKTLFEKLCGELPGIFRWAVDGYHAWKRQGLGVPPAIARATESYRRDSDLLGPFLRDRCVISPKARATSGELWRAYQRWARDEGDDARLLIEVEFRRHLTALGYRPAKGTAGARMRSGITLQREWR